MHGITVIVPTNCNYCNEFILTMKQGYRCDYCYKSFHKKCAKVAPKLCKNPTLAKISDDNSAIYRSMESISVKTVKMDDITSAESSKKTSTVSTASNASTNSTSTAYTTSANSTSISTPTTSDTSIISSSSNLSAHNSNEGLGKISRVRYTKRKSQIQRIRKKNEMFWSGTISYYTDKETTFKTNYWKLDAQSLTIYDSAKQEVKLKEIQIDQIKSASSADLDDKFINDQKCLFIIKTNDETFFCGDGSMALYSSVNSAVRNFHNLLKMALLPFGNRKLGARKSIKITAPKYEEKSLDEEYQLNSNELLGEGQFGKVYSGVCRTNKTQVAIKIVNKRLLENKNTETSVFQNEITILYNLKHQGIVQLLALYDEPEMLYIVTEKLSTDMLEFILQSENSSLSERLSKFLIYQILIGLKKLHDMNIAHCDLKPENILLVNKHNFPQTKICDFGYARIIGENSLRRSIVGTPAYAPPELKEKKVYNNSIDMWSMGVIIYVCLSGQFPFDDDQNIQEQLVNIDLFPEETWKNISSNAIDLINSFLQVRMQKRLSVSKSLQHPWFDDDEDLYYDLLDLEKRVNENWLTTPEQKEKWEKSSDL